MTNDLIERYIYAVVKKLPNNLKDDVSKELRSLIDDMLTERCKDVTPSDKDIKVVLTELGTPNELYEKYNPDTKKCLIGSPYYSTYKYVLKIVLICTGIGLVISTIIAGIIDICKDGSVVSEASGVINFQPWISLFVNLFTNLPIGLIMGFAFVTLLFAFFYHKGIKIDTTNNLDSLPPVPKKTQRISKTEPIISICFLTIFLIVFLIVPEILCVIVTNPHELVPIFNTEAVRSAWYILVLFSSAGVIREIIMLFEGQYNKKVMVSSIIANAASALFAVWWLLRDNIINEKFINSLTAVFDKDETFIINIFSNFQYFFLGVILFALILDTVTVIVKTLRK